MKTEEKFLPCPFCGNKIINVYEEQIKDENHRFFGSSFAFASCYYCRSEGPKFYTTDQSDEEINEYALKVWNERREKSLSQEIKDSLKN